MLLLFDILLIGDCPTFSIPRTTAVADRVHGIEKSRHHKKHPFSSDYLNITGGARIDRLLSLLQGVPLLQRLVLPQTFRYCLRTLLICVSNIYNLMKILLWKTEPFHSFPDNSMDYLGMSSSQHISVRVYLQV